jgi:hypothetical protein
MIGNFNLPIAKGNAKTFIFTADNVLATSNPWRGLATWNKPKGINFVYGLLIGGGSGGGGGFSMGAGTTGGGGGGGTPGAVMQFLQPAYLVPDTLSVSVSRGGTGGAAGTSGGFPNLVSGLWYPLVGQTTLNISRIYYALPSSNLSGVQSGRTGTGAAGGNGGTAATLSTTSNQPGIIGFSNYFLPAALAGFAGTLVAGTNATFSGRPAGGAGGGGVTSGTAYAGGNVLAPTTSEQSIWNRNLSGGANDGSAGENGITLFEPTFFSLPGAGGGANASGTGGAGGKGGIGCGGGGGGAGTTGGRGGDGGDGLVMLVCW